MRTRATLAAVDESETDPLMYLRDEVAEHAPLAAPDDAEQHDETRRSGR